MWRLGLGAVLDPTTPSSGGRGIINIELTNMGGSDTSAVFWKFAVDDPPDGAVGLCDAEGRRAARPPGLVDFQPEKFGNGTGTSRSSGLGALHGLEDEFFLTCLLPVSGGESQSITEPPKIQRTDRP
jgi:hypothetical protein